MRKLVGLGQLLLIVVIGASMYSPALAQSTSGSLPSPCKLESSAVYLVIDSTRRHIVNWDTFLNLGYKASDIVSCGEAGAYPEGAAITRLIKGAGEQIYWMENGLRRHIPDMATFDAMGFKAGNVSVLPDAIVALWPVGDPLPSSAVTVADQVTIGRYTIQLIKQGTAVSYALISAPGLRAVKVPYIYQIGTLPVADVTGEGDPDVLFVRNYDLSLFGLGTVVYNLGARPTKVLDMSQGYHQTPTTGQGEFKDLNADGRFEFVTLDTINAGRLPCILVDIPVILQYSPARRRYVSASPQFPDYYSNLINGSTTPDTQCKAIVILIHLDRSTEAKALFDQLYPGSDMWTDVVSRVRRGRYFVRKR